MITPPPLVCLILLSVVAATAAVFDLRVRRIPNWLTVTGIIAGIIFNTFLFEWTGLRMSLAGMATAFTIYFVLYLLRAMGAGDVKLMAAVGAIVGLANWFAIFLITAFLGGICALLMMLLRKRVRQSFANIGFIVSEMMHFRPAYLGREELSVKSKRALKMPHGAVIAAGCMVFLAISLRAIA